MAPLTDDGRDDVAQVEDAAEGIDAERTSEFAPIVLITIAETCRRTTIGRTKLYELVRARRFPQPITVTGRRRAFVEAEVEDWLHARMAERDS